MNIHEPLSSALKHSTNDKFVSELTSVNKHLETLNPESLSSSFRSPSVCEVLLCIANKAVIKEVKDREHAQFSKDDFQGYSRLALAVLECFDIFLESVCKVLTEKESKTSWRRLCPTLLYLTSANIAPNLWTTPKVNNKAKHVLNLLKQCFGAGTYSELLTSPVNEDDAVTTQTSTLYGGHLVCLKTNLTKDNWMKNPFAKCSFIWTLVHMKFPDLSDYLHQVIPFPLTMVDNFSIENKILGVHCLHHVIENVSKEELRWYGRAEVVYDALKHQMYTKDAGLIMVLMPAVLSILSVVEKDHKADVYSDVNRYDDIFKMILLNCEMENSIHIRRAQTTHLPLFINALGIAAARHTKTVIRVVTSYLEIYDGPEETARLNMLETLRCFIVVAWPRIPTHTNVILKSQLRFLHDVATDKTVTPMSVKQQMTSGAGECLRLLHLCSPEVVLEALQKITDSNISDEVKAIMKQICDLISQGKTAS